MKARGPRIGSRPRGQGQRPGSEIGPERGRRMAERGRRLQIRQLAMPSRSHSVLKDRLRPAVVVDLLPVHNGRGSQLHAVGEEPARFPGRLAERPVRETREGVKSDRRSPHRFPSCGRRSSFSTPWRWNSYRPCLRNWSATADLRSWALIAACRDATRRPAGVRGTCRR